MLLAGSQFFFSVVLFISHSHSIRQHVVENTSWKGLCLRSLKWTSILQWFEVFDMKFAKRIFGQTSNMLLTVMNSLVWLNSALCLLTADELYMLETIIFTPRKGKQLDSKEEATHSLMPFWWCLMKFLTQPCFKSTVLDAAFMGHCTKTRSLSFGQMVGRCQLMCYNHKQTLPLVWKECVAFYLYSVDFWTFLKELLRRKCFFRSEEQK